MRPTAMRRSSKSRRGPGAARATFGFREVFQVLPHRRQVVKLRYLLEDVKQLVPIWNESAMQASLVVLTPHTRENAPGCGRCIR